MSPPLDSPDTTRSQRTPSSTPGPLIRSTWRTAHERAVVSNRSSAQAAQRLLDPRARACLQLSRRVVRFGGCPRFDTWHCSTSLLPVPARKQSSCPRQLARCLLVVALARVQSSDIRQSREILGLFQATRKKRREQRRRGALRFLIAVLRDDGVRWWCEDDGCRCRGDDEDGCAMGYCLQLLALLGDLPG